MITLHIPEQVKSSEQVRVKRTVLKPFRCQTIEKGYCDLLHLLSSLERLLARKIIPVDTSVGKVRQDLSTTV